MENVHDLTGGTLVEYKTSRRWGEEYGRVRILQVIVTSKFNEEIECPITRVEFKTDGKACYGGSLFEADSVREKDGVTYYFPPPYMRVMASICYAFAPHGVEIPLPAARGFDPMDLFTPSEKAAQAAL